MIQHSPNFNKAIGKKWRKQSEFILIMAVFMHYNKEQRNDNKIPKSNYSRGRNLSHNCSAFKRLNSISWSAKVAYVNQYQSSLPFILFLLSPLSQVTLFCNWSSQFCSNIPFAFPCPQLSTNCLYPKAKYVFLILHIPFKSILSLRWGNWKVSFFRIKWNWMNQI